MEKSKDYFKSEIDGQAANILGLSLVLETAINNDVYFSPTTASLLLSTMHSSLLKTNAMLLHIYNEDYLAEINPEFMPLLLPPTSPNTK